MLTEIPIIASKTFGKNSYRLLPKCLTIKSSDIDGLGLFATENIPAKVYLGETHFKIDPLADWLRTPLGGFINHSDSGNASINLREDNIRGLTTERAITKGEEITVSYTLY